MSIENKLILARNKVLDRLKDTFKKVAIEGHVFGSIARGDDDFYSDIDIWFTFNDEEFEKIKNKRFEYYSYLGQILHVCEPPQNAPINGIHSALIINDQESLIMVDIYLCPQSSSFMTKEAKKLFGENLTLGEIGLNPQKVKVDQDYRIDFFICFLFNAIKKIKRNQKLPLVFVFEQYDKLIENYNIQLKKLQKRKHDIETLEEIIEIIKNHSNDKQKKVLSHIHNFMRRVLNTDLT